jgi:selenophosphate synthetase-related protein
MVNVMAGLQEDQEKAVCFGMRDECRRLRVPMVGGHVSPEGEVPFLAAAVLGEAGTLLADRNARPGQVVLLAIDLRGERWGDYLLNWDSHSAKDPETLCRDLAILCDLADLGLCRAAKDVSNAGILGTLAMLLENAGLGAQIDLARLRVPEPFSLADWLKVYPSYGFFLLCEPSARASCLERFEERGIWAAEVGSTNRSATLRTCLGEEEEEFIDIHRAGILNLPGS